jgi:hypothetical protein
LVSQLNKLAGKYVPRLLKNVEMPLPMPAARFCANWPGLLTMAWTTWEALAPNLAARSQTLVIDWPNLGSLAGPTH